MTAAVDRDTARQARGHNPPEQSPCDWCGEQCTGNKRDAHERLDAGSETRWWKAAAS